MPRTTPPFRADHVGSLLRPPELLRAREDFAAGRATADNFLRAVEDGAIREVVRMQEEVGLRAATDGEFRRASWHMDFIYALGGVFLEYDDARSGTFEPLRFMPESKMVVLGLVITKRGDLEFKDDLIRRIEEAGRHVPIERLCLSPQCGFSPTVEGNALTREQQAAKLRLVVETAEEVWG